jgi:hypothetical protein
MTPLFIHHPLLFQSTKKMSDNPIKFPSSPSSSEDELPSYHSFEENISSSDGMSDYSPPWSSEKEDPEEEDEEEEDNADVEDDDDDSNFASPPPKRARRAYI